MLGDSQIRTGQQLVLAKCATTIRESAKLLAFGVQEQQLHCQRVMGTMAAVSPFGKAT